MAQNSILKLNVDTSEYDAKIKSAAAGIQQYAQKCHEAGGTLQYLDDGVLEFVQALGKMDTASSSTKMQVREMSNALSTLTMTYRGLSDAEKSSPFGQELAKGIQQLTERAGQAQDAMMDVQQSIRNAASDTRAFDQISQGASVVTASFQGLVGAGKMLGFEMGNDVEVIAKLQSAMAVTNSLTTIQTALQKQSALMQGVQAAQTAIASAAQTTLATTTGSATAAQAAFNAVANMNPYVALATAIAAVAGAYFAWTSNANKAKKAQEALNAELDNTKIQLAQIDKDTDFSVGIMQAAGKSWKAIHEVRLEAARTKLQLADMNYDKLAESGASKEQMQKASEMQQQAWDNVMKVLNEGTIHWAKEFYGKGKGGSGSGHGKGGISTSVEKTEEQMNSEQIEKLTQEYIKATDERRQAIQKEIAVLQNRNAEIQKLKDMALGKSFDGGTLDGEVVVTGSKMTSINKTFRDAPVNFDSINAYISGIKDQMKNYNLGDAMYDALTEKLKDATTMSTLIQELMERGVEGADLESVAEQMKAALLDGDIPDEKVKDFIAKLNEQIKEQGGIELDYNANTGEVSDKKQGKSEDAMKKFSAEAGKFVGGLGEVANGLRAVGVSIPNEVNELLSGINGFMQIISGFQSLISMVSTPAQIANTTAIANLTAILTAKMFMPGMNNGGIVPHAANGYFVSGTHMSGDVTPIMANEGELVLNKAQQFSLAAQLTSGYGAMGAPEVRFSGEDLFVVMSNYLQRAGYGEILTSKG